MVKKKLDQVVYEHIIRQVGNGQLLQREHVTEQGVADELDISRTPVRKAFEQLVEDGYLETIENVGVRVKAQTLDSKGFQDRVNFIEQPINHYLFDLEKREAAFKTDGLESALERMKKAAKEDDESFEKSELEYWRNLMKDSENDYTKYAVLKVVNDLLFDDGFVQNILKDSRVLKVRHFGELTSYLKENNYPRARREIRILLNQLKLNVIEHCYNY